LSCLANDNCVCSKCAKIKQSYAQILETKCLSGLNNDDCRCDNCIKKILEDTGEGFINCHFCNDKILVSFPLICKTCNYIGCLKCLNDDCKCSNCTKIVLRSGVCYACESYKEVNSEGFCDDCIRQTELYHSKNAHLKVEFIKNSNHDPIISDHPVQKEIDIPGYREAVTDVDRLIKQIYPNFKGEGPCKECKQRTTRRIVFQITYPDPYFLCMSCAKCSMCGGKYKGSCWSWPANEELVCGLCVCGISIPRDIPWDESSEAKVSMFDVIDIYKEKTRKKECELTFKLRDRLLKRISDQEQLETMTL
jgi:hypothetical protein